MFEVRFTSEAKALFVRQAQQGGFAKPGVTILRQGPKGEVTRNVGGQAEWNVEQPHPWRAMVGDFQSFGENPTDVVVVEGIAVWLALVPKLGELGVTVSVRNNALHVEPLAA
jgi:hypothetical protein